MGGDPFNLDRFVEAQRPTYAGALAELRRGEKTSHWMWFVFPQIEGLGFSPTSRHYAISGLDEACAYLAHPVLGARLRECARAVNSHAGRSALQIFGPPDDMKFRSSLTLFAEAAPDEPIFSQALARFFAGEPDPLTLARLGA
ncbi:MAG TPA: DUF1810 domain-containing protein [Caulobacteraceae bacterium]|jgi:uncharacterized protein (DUF1810 family)|nr:DUF1810 domain-containing protein [Caulobacteraceae bacterium]